MMAKIRPANMINAGISQPQQQMPQQQSLNIINNNNNNIAPTNQIANNNQPNIPTQFNNIGQQQQQQQQPMAQVNASNTADDELYNKKIEELRLHLPRLERMHSSALGRTHFLLELLLYLFDKI
jgi:adenine-specific DNA methylase